MINIKRRRRSVENDQSDDSASSSQQNVYPCPVEPAQFSLLSLPSELQYQILLGLNALSLARMGSVCSVFRVADAKTLLRVTDKAARDLLRDRCDPNRMGRWWRPAHTISWPQQLMYEEAAAEFDTRRCAELGFAFTPDQSLSRVEGLELTTMGPKLLVSKLSTADRPALRWHIRVMGNTALEFGVVPVGMEDQQRCLHKCMNLSAKPLERPVGFSSNITSGSQQLVKAPVGKESEVEILAVPGRVDFIISNPPTTKCARTPGGEPGNDQQVPPSELRFTHLFPLDVPMKLAATNWAFSKFEVLHHVPIHREDRGGPDIHPEDKAPEEAASST